MRQFEKVDVSSHVLIQRQVENKEHVVKETDKPVMLSVLVIPFIDAVDQKKLS